MKFKQNVITVALLSCLSLGISYSSSAKEVSNNDVIIHHVTFPYNDNQSTIDKFNLSTPYANRLITSNLIAGGMYYYLLHKTYPDLVLDKTYIFGDILAQLLQESGLGDASITPSFNPDVANQNIENDTYTKQLLSPGQGGPWQINDYGKRLPDATTPGSLGLINYDAMRKILGYTISEQDENKQTEKEGPQSLADMYSGPMAATYWLYNNVHRMDTLAFQSWYVNSKSWNQCMANLQNKKYTQKETKSGELTDTIFAVAYNQGSYGDYLSSLLNNECKNFPTNKDALNNLNNYNIGASDNTYQRYPKQITFYTNQLFNRNNKLAPSLQVNNHVVISDEQLIATFNKVFTKMSYPDLSGKDLIFISEKMADSAIKKALTQQDTSFNLSSTDDQNKLFNVIQNAISDLESSVKLRAKNQKFSFAQVTGEIPLCTDTIPEDVKPWKQTSWWNPKNNYVKGDWVSYQNNIFEATGDTITKPTGEGSYGWQQCTRN